MPVVFLRPARLWNSWMPWFWVLCEGRTAALLSELQHLLFVFRLRGPRAVSPAALPPWPPVSGFWSHCGFSLRVFFVHSAALLTCLLVSFPVPHLLTFCFGRVYLPARPAFPLSWFEPEQLRLLRTLPCEAVLRGSRGSRGVWSLEGAVASELSPLLLFPPCAAQAFPNGGWPGRRPCLHGVLEGSWRQCAWVGDPQYQNLSLKCLSVFERYRFSIKGAFVAGRDEAARPGGPTRWRGGAPSVVTALPHGEACPGLAQAGWGAGGLQGGAGARVRAPLCLLSVARAGAGAAGAAGAVGARTQVYGRAGLWRPGAPVPASRSSRSPGAKGRAPRPGVQAWPRPRVEESGRAQQPRPSRPRPRGGCLPHGGAACRLQRNVTQTSR